MRIVTILLAAFSLLLPFSGTTKAQDQPITCRDWLAIQSWSGTITISGSGSSSDQFGNSASISESATVTFSTDRSPSPCDVNDLSGVGGGWSGANSQMTYSVKIHDEYQGNSEDENHHSCVQTINQDIDGGTSSNRSGQINMHFTSATSGTFSINVAQTVDGVKETFSGCGGSGSTTTQLDWGSTIGWPTNGLPLPGTIGPLTGSTTIQDFGGSLGTPVTWSLSWNFTPAISYDMYLTTNPDYDTWRPTGGRDENELSGIIGLHAVLIDKVTGQPATNASADQWNFTLKDVSHEPGVAMNYPPKKKLIVPSPADLDFKFGNDTVFPNMEVSEDGTSVIVKPDPATDANVVMFISSHDWGAWATLNVTVEVAGQTLKGHFENDETTDILLPKRQPGSFIADSWKMDHNIALDTPDSDDSETDPVGYPGCTGDGLTLYEEYRGFMENGKHIEGDPTKKDFFIQNIGGGDLKPGISKFIQITGLNVHKDLLADEMDGLHGTQLGDRLINFNHGQGAQEIPQHGVVIAVCSDTNGGVTTLTQTGVHGRPGLTTGICMEWRNHGGAFDPQSLGTDNTHHGAITKTAALQQYDLAVAHELSHSVGVDHHGDGDTGNQRFTLVGPNDPRNTTGQPAFLLGGQSGIVHVLREETGADVAPPMWAKVTKQVTDYCGQVSAIYSPQLFSRLCQAFINGALPLFTDLTFYIGRPQRQHSGNDQCIMRYFFANGYPSTANSSTFYLSAAGTEPVGTGLCSSAAGTGINAPSHQPQSRYSDAAANRGGCQKWVCVNDKYAPIPD